MLPHEGYNMLYAQGMGDESYGVGYHLVARAMEQQRRRSPV